MDPNIQESGYDTNRNVIKPADGVLKCFFQNQNRGIQNNTNKNNNN